MNLISSKENIRIDKYLSDELPYSRGKIAKMINEGNITINGKAIKASYKVKLNDKIDIKEFSEEQLVSQNINIDIVYEDKDIIVINKPSGMIVHPGSGNKTNTLVNALLYHDNNIKNVGEKDRPGIVHRLDKDTSGLMLVAKTKDAYDILTKDFKNKKIHREYIALLEGVLPKDKILIDAPIGRDPKNFQKRAIVPTGKKAITHIEIIQKYNNYTLVKAILETGRTHQIRVHTKYIGYPVFNDPLYGNKKATKFGQYLHSYYLKFNHPITKKEMVFKEDLPKEFKETLVHLKNDMNKM